MKPKSTLRHFLVLAGSSLLAVSSASAQTNLFWDQNGDSTAATGGTGTWNTTNTWRSGSSTGTLGDWTDGNVAVFGGTAGTVTLSAPVSAAGLTFSTNAYIVTGSTLTLAGASAPVLNVSTGTSTISSNIDGIDGLEKTGAGTLILSGTNNTYSGTTTISAGILQGNKTISGASPFGTSTIQLNAGTLSSVTSSATDTAETFTFGNNINVGGDATINFTRVGGVGSGKTHAYGNLSIGSNTLSFTANNIGHSLSFTGATLTGNAIINNGSNATLNLGAITETGGARNFTKQGAATLRFTGNNTYTGTTTISGGTLEVQGSIASSSGIINNSTLFFNSASTQMYGNVISGSGNLTKEGTGILVLTGANTYTGTTTIGGTAGSTVVINTLKNYNEASSLGAPTSGAVIFSKNSSNYLVYAGSGNTTNRTIRHEPDVSNRNNGSGIYNNGTGALIFNGTTFNTPFVASGNGGRTTTFNLGGTFAGSANEIRGVIADNDASSRIAITKIGSGTWTLGGDNTFTGATTLNAGTLKLNYDTGTFGTNTSKLADTNGILALNGGTLELHGGSHVEAVTSTTLNNGTTFIKQTGGGSSTLSMGVITYTGGALDFSAAGIANVSTSAVTNSILSSAAGTARVTVGGADWAAKDGTNNVIAYTGYTNFDGTASAANVNYSTVGNATLTASRGATSNTFKITTSGTGQSMKLNSNFNLTLGSLLFAGADDYTIAAESGTGRINSAFLLHNYGAGTLTLGATNGLITQFGTGKTILSGNNASNVGINIFGGTVQFSNNLQIGTNTGVQAIALNNGTLLANTAGGDIALNNGGLNSRTVTLGAGGGTLDVIGGGKLTVSGVISDTAGQFPTLTIGSGSSNGTVELTGTNTYRGTTFISGGTLAVTGSGSINSSSGITIASGAEFKYNSSTALTVGITNNGGRVSGSGNLGAIVLGGTGSIDPGNSPGIMTAASTDPSAGLDYNFEFTAANTNPTWSDASASVNDVLRLTGGTPFGGILDSDNVVSIYLDVASVTLGQTFTGGFFTDLNSDFLTIISGANFQFFIQDDGGLTSYNGQTYTAYAGLFNVSTIQIGSADFAGGTVTNGWSTQFTAAIPEPGAALLGGLGTLLLLRRRRSA